MLSRIFPVRIDNAFRGHRLALWLFTLILLQKLALSLTHLFRADGGAQSGSRMPLDSYPDGAAQNIVGLMARMGLEQFLLASFMVLALVRYRAMIPLMYLVVVVQYLMARGVTQMKPLARAGPSGVATMALIVASLAVIGLVLSVTGRGYRDHASTGAGA